MYQQTNPNEMPGVGTTIVSAYKPIWLGKGGVQYKPGGAVIDGQNARDPQNTYSGNLPNAQTSYVNVLEPGLLMGKITQNPVISAFSTVAGAVNAGAYGASVLGLTTAAYTAEATSITVAAATAAELVRRIGNSGQFNLIGPAASGNAPVTQLVTYSAVNQTTGVITCTGVADAAVVGSIVAPNDGSQVIKTFIDEEDGIRVTDMNGNGLPIQFARVPIAGGVVNSANIVNYASADAGVQTWIKTALCAAGLFLFSDNM